jgi:hypothetical protein
MDSGGEKKEHPLVLSQRPKSEPPPYTDEVLKRVDDFMRDELPERNDDG